MTKLFHLLFYSLLVPNILFAQSKIEGNVLNKNAQPLEDVSVVLLEKNKTVITAFAITDSKGFFAITYDGKVDSIKIQVTIIGYEMKGQMIANKSQSLTFMLGEKNTELPTVLVKEQPITKQGDTTNYLVKNFTNKQDRVIGDVIAKLPGVEIDENTGAIKFNGKFISHYYIDGLDLLESKYNIANRNIPADLVDQVQLLDNHQDIKIFDSLKISREPALNIKLKKKAKNKLIGKAKAGAGVYPLLWDNEITGLQFNKGFQLITSYKNNNTGSSLSAEISDNVSIQRVGDNREKNTKVEVINKLQFLQPNISTKRYLFNNSHLLHFNVLKVLTSKAQLKFNMSYLNDNIINENNIQSTYILPNGQQINFAENKTSFINTNKVEGNTIYTVNNKNLYIKNTAKIKLDFTKEASTIINPAIVSQILQNPFYEYSNDFLLHKPIKKKIVSFNSKLNYNKMPQVLAIIPGQFKDIFNQTIAYEQLSQKATLNNFNTDNSISFFTRIAKVNQQIKIGAEYIHKNIQTNISKDYNKTIYQLSDSFKNNIDWDNLRIYAENSTTIGKGKTQLEITLPIEYNFLTVKNKIEHYSLRSKNLFFNPSIDFTFPIVENINGSVSYTLQNTIGNITSITNGFILNSYRNINRNDTLLPLQNQQSVNGSLFYKNSLKAIFSNLNFSLSQTKNNIIYNQVFDGFFINAEGVYKKNYQKSFMINGNTSKYIIESKIGLNLNYSFNTTQADLLQQNQIVKSDSRLISLGLKTNLNMFSFASFEINSKYDYFKNEIKQFTPSITNRFQQFVKLYFYPSKKSTIYFNNELYKVWDNKNNKGNYYFGDIGFKQKFKKTDIEIEWTNIGNSKNYTTINNNQNLKQISLYQIRPTNVMVKFYFNF